jgi:hypothetical protein
MRVEVVRILVLSTFLFSLGGCATETLPKPPEASVMSFEQQSTPLSNTINLLEGSIQANGLPDGWMTSVDNFNCTVKFQNGALNFERLSPDEKCSFAFNKTLSNGDYLLKTTFKIDGNNPQIFLDGKPLEQQNEIKVIDGILRVGIQTRGSGKIWGNIFSMTLTKIPKSSPF